MNAPEQARDYLQARADSGAQYPEGDCLGSERDAWFGPGQHAFGGTAATAYAATKVRAPGHGPFGSLDWWLGGSTGAGHVAFDLGDGTCLTTDFGPDRYYGDGRIRRVPIDIIAAQSNPSKPLVFQGHSLDLDGEQPEAPMILVQKKDGGPIYRYDGNHIDALSTHQVQRAQGLGAKIIVLNDTDEIFSLTPPVSAPATTTSTLPAHVHSLAAGQTGAAK